MGLNDAVDAVLRTIYDTTTFEGHIGRRNVVLTSFSPDVCLALNWKQPNCTSRETAELGPPCLIFAFRKQRSLMHGPSPFIPDPVFFASHCGRHGRYPPSATALSVGDAHDYRLGSLNSAVELCKLNNLLGVLLDAELLVRIYAPVTLWAAIDDRVSYAAPGALVDSGRERFRPPSWRLRRDRAWRNTRHG